jgi:hypothetical protein
MITAHRTTASRLGLERLRDSDLRSEPTDTRRNPGKQELSYQSVLLDKKGRLSGRILRVAKVAQADANQAEPPLRAEADTFAERQGNVRQLLARGRRRTWRVAASENLEFAGLQFQYNGASDS